MSGRWGFAVALLGCAAVGCAERGTPRLAEGWLAVSEEIHFGPVALHSGREREVILRNAGRGRIGVLEVWTQGPAGTYRAVFTHPGPHELVSGGECGVRVRYTPQALGDHPGTLVVRTDSVEEPIFRVQLSGTGVEAAAEITPEQLEFGRIELESEKTLVVTLRNRGALPLEVSPQWIGADRGEFTVSGPIQLGPEEERELPVTFRPTAVGRKRAVLALAPCRGCGDLLIKVDAEGIEQAVIPEPPVLDFGQVPVDRDATLEVALHNVSTEPIEVLSLALDAATDPSFTAAPAALPRVVAPDERARFAFRYTPGHMNAAGGLAHFRVASRRHPTVDVELRGFGGSAELCIAPLGVDFGAAPVGAKLVQKVSIKNCGASSAAPMTVFDLTIAPDGGAPGADQFSLAPVSLPRTLAAGDELEVRVFFEPTRAEDAAAVLHVRTSAFSAAHVEIGLRGRGEGHAPCQVAITPAALDFGTVPPGQGAVLGLKVENVGADLCAVKNIFLADDGRGAFRMPGGPLVGGIMHPGNAFSFQVAFVPPHAGVYTGAVQLEPADPANPRVLVPITGNAQPSCLVATPAYLDFGLARPDCPPAPLEVRLENACAAPETITGIHIGPGTTDGEFSLTHVPSLPRMLAPGGMARVEVAYAAQVPGMNLSPLFVEVPSLAAPLLVPLLGESSIRGTQTDEFIQQDESKVDVLFVIDNTASMVEEHPRLVAALPAFAQAALATGADLHVAVITTGIEPVSAACPGGARGGEAGRLFPADGSSPRLLTHATPDLGLALQRNAAVGQCALVEKGLEAMRRALSPPLVDHADDPRTPLANDGNVGFYREEASLVVVFVGDEDDHSPDDVDTYVQFVRHLKGAHQPGRGKLFAIAPTGSGCATAGGSGTRYAEAAARTGGQVMSICAADYAPLLEAVAHQAFSPQDRFPLSAVPDPGTLTVTIDGVPVTSGWSYDPATNQVVFSPRPEPGARISVTYRKACP